MSSTRLRTKLATRVVRCSSLLLLVGALVDCVVPPLDEGLPGPCAEGFVVVAGRCLRGIDSGQGMREGGVDLEGGVDARIDVGPPPEGGFPDVGSSDIDIGPHDGGPTMPTAPGSGSTIQSLGTARASGGYELRDESFEGLGYGCTGGLCLAGRIEP